MTKFLKVKYVLTVAVFTAVIFGLAIAAMFIPAKENSISERRSLTQITDVVAYSIFDREFSEKLESYNLDQFPIRDSFRRVNAMFRFYGLMQLDTDGLWLHDGVVLKSEANTDETQVSYAASYYNAIIDAYLKDCSVYYTVVPDKSYFTQDLGYPHLDYDRILEIMTTGVKGAEYIDILDTLSLDKYYRTDTHWLQPQLFETLQRLGDAMGVGEYLTAEADYTAHTLSPFYGVYLQQAALPIDPESLTYLTSRYTDSAVVTGPQYKAEGIYDLEKFEGMDGYDVFLSGTQPVIEIECPDAKTDRELYIFRDSFGSSLAPLFTGAYKKITVIDMRYVTGSYLPNVVTFTPGADVLFINSTLVLNTAMIMR